MSACDLFIFAAGTGTRLRPYTEVNPKPCIPLFSIPLGYYLLPYINKLPIKNRIVNTFHLPNQIKDLYRSCFDIVQFSDEVGFIKGSAGGLKQAEGLFSDAPAIVATNADEVFFAQDRDFFKKALQRHLDQNNLATLIVMDHPGVGEHFGGVWCEDQRIRSIAKKFPEELRAKHPRLKGWHFIGLQILSKEVLSLVKPKQEQNIFYDVLIHHLADARCEIFPVEGHWYETGNRNDYLNAKSEISRKQSSDVLIQRLFSDLAHYPKSKLADIS